MVKVAGVLHYRKAVEKAMRRHGSLVLAELRVETTGQYAGAVRVYVDGEQVGSMPSDPAHAYRDLAVSLAREGKQTTIHAELVVDGFVDVWGLCKPQLRKDGEPLLPTQYREDVALLDGVAAILDQSLNSRAKEKKVRRNGVLSLGSDGTWSVSESGRVLGTIARKPYKRLHEVLDAGLPLDVVVTIHRVPEHGLIAHVSIPPDEETT